ncbi:MAG: hypothetical protein OEY36_04540 [Gammaproteobacteria bacterium]|nr:hypothetical protein [Gammaproteobacteria bacterium]
MDIKKLITTIYWLSLALVVVFLPAHLLHTFHFQQSAIRTEAQIHSVNKQWLFYRVGLGFETRYKTPLKADVSLFKKPQSGQIVAVLYNPIVPADVRPDSFLAVWSSSLMLLLLLGFLIVLMYSGNVCVNWKRNSRQKLKQAGNHIYTRFKSVEAVLKVSKDGRHPYQIISSWEDVRAKKTYLFKSDYIWQNPIEYIMGDTITVMIDSKNKKKYLMDLGFLPENLQQ